MAWIRAIWSEGNHLEEETVPSTWVVNEEVFWPPFGKNAEAYRRNRRPPGTSWRKFPLVRVKNASDNFKECADMTITSTETEEAEETTQQRQRKRKHDDAYLYEEQDGQRFSSGDDTVQDDYPNQEEAVSISKKLPRPPGKLKKKAPTGAKAGTKSSSEASMQRNTLDARAGTVSSSKASTQKSILGTRQKNLFNLGKDSETDDNGLADNMSDEGSETEDERDPTFVPNTEQTSGDSNSDSDILIAETQMSRQISHSGSSMQIRTQNTRDGSSDHTRKHQNTKDGSSDHTRKHQNTQDGSSDHTRKHQNTKDGSSKQNETLQGLSRVPAAKEIEKQYLTLRKALYEICAEDSEHPECEEDMHTDIPSHSRKEFQRKVLLLLFEIRDLIKSKPTDPDEEVLLIQQCQSMEELEALEKTLRDISVRKNVILQLSRVGGASVRDNVVNVMLRVLTNEVMATMNLTGSHGKIAFENTALYRVVKDAILRSQPDATEYQIRLCMGSYLKYAPDRKGGGGRS